MEESEKMPFWKQHGFKKMLGGILTVIGGVLYLFNNQALSMIGTGLAIIGGVLAGIGTVHTVVKQQQGVDRSINVWSTLADKLKNRKKEN